MVNEAVAKTIEKQFQFDLNYLDFFYPYTEAKGYEDVESDPNITDEEYDTLETQFFSILPRQEMVNLKYEIQRFIERRIKELMTDVVEKEEDR